MKIKTIEDLEKIKSYKRIKKLFYTNFKNI